MRSKAINARSIRRRFRKSEVWIFETNPLYAVALLSRTAHTAKPLTPKATKKTPQKLNQLKLLGRFY
ncbi:hypothetical protein JCM14108_437 [Lentilactobacillus farraginis DSM 18382 = JCM 14108]|uniref:Uncharacterized protein n=1 Tax=Lentilactobacillus farraginis DSM 18382 = JCM 14108 TaxID=1423743 RepID=X0P9B9_9LACO|nr:hypothetical protein JCM14108_437 [Lentilactobacillus farraginis DSM 18382 = JCM 14108]